MTLLDRLRDHLDTLRELPGIVTEALDERRRLLETGFLHVEDLAEAWHSSELRAGSRKVELEALRNDVDRAREDLYRALGGEEEVDYELPRLSGLVAVAEARLEKAGRARSSSIEPRWDYVARAIPLLDEIVKSEALYVGRVDRIGARIRDQYDELGLQVTDEDVLYVTLVVLGMVVELASDGVRNGSATPLALRNLAAVTQTYAAALIPYLPAEARR